jgi:pimeloyl-ACP methyl ester carboxylesterase
MVFLHGFLGFWRSWEAQLRALSAGHHVVALDQRGYNHSQKPDCADAYTPDRLAGDVAGVIEALDHKEAVIVGHGWGGVVAWWLALTRPEIVSGLVVLNAPHPHTFLPTLMRHPTQIVRSGYMLFLQLPWLPEWLLTRQRAALVHRVMRRALDGQDGCKRDAQAYRDAILCPGAARGSLNWYRALRLPHTWWRLRQVSPIVHVPSLVIWGGRDPWLGRYFLEPLDVVAPSLRVEQVPDAGHFVHLDRSEEVSRLIAEFASACGATTDSNKEISE